MKTLGRRIEGLLSSKSKHFILISSFTFNLYRDALKRLISASVDSVTHLQCVSPRESLWNLPEVFCASPAI